MWIFVYLLICRRLLFAKESLAANQTELIAISDDHELGLMIGMVTRVQNDLSLELVGHARRGPCVVPTSSEKIT